ncbi:ArnT family glycosyltransferase [Ferribacterium limneticum]|uniref:ArnT family glycosyltransferase n=1 Tax=Ferribacterium limneticum TaxID=76259 RepID=UPI001CF9434B|nr:glycosyltransferase family 39 protein [Ferribacterium limneticum]UCV19544.1 hypothetical protein KI610_02875 [Ferribacterium limneticum]
MGKPDSGWCLFLIVACGGLYAGLWSDGHNWGGDFAAYIMQATSIVNGSADEFVVRNAFTVNQSSSPVGPVAYPWGFPLLLAPVYSVFGMSLFAFKAVGLFFYLLFLVTLWFGFKPLLKPAELVVFVALFAFNPAMLLFGDNILSDVPFLYFSTLSIVMLSRLNCSRSLKREFVFRLILGAVIGAAFLVRTNGALLVLVYAVMGVLGSQKKIGSSAFERRLIASIPVVVFFLTVAIASLFLPDGQSSHFSHLSKISLWFLLHNFIYYAELLKEFFSPNAWRLQLGFVIYILTIPVVVAAIRSAWRESVAMLLYLFLTIVLYVAWPYQEGLRFIFPIIPIYIYFLIIGLRSFALSIPSVGKWYMLPLAGLAFIFAVSTAYAVYQSQMSGRVIPQGPYTEQAVEMFAFIAHNTLEGDIVVFRKPRVMRLFTGRSSIRVDNVVELPRGDLLVIDRNNQTHQIGMLETQALLSDETISSVFSNESFEIFRLKTKAENSLP